MKTSVPVVSLALLPVLLAALPRPFPDSWMPFANQRVVSASGKRYVVIKKQGLGITYELCERAPGVGPIKPAQTSTIQFGGGRKKVSVDREPGDRLRVAGKYGQLPLGVLVPDKLDGFLLFEKYANVGYGKSLVWIDGKGEVRFEYTLMELFGGKHPKGTSASVSSLWWNRGYWIDEKNAAVVLVTSEGELRAVSIVDGSISAADDAQILDGAVFGAPAGRALAMEMVAEGPIERCKKAMSLVAATFLDKQQPLNLRLRAGWILHRAGAPEGVGELFAKTARDGKDKVVRQFAVAHLPNVLGDRAMPILRDMMRGKATDIWGYAYQAFASMGERAVPTLLEMLAEVEESNDYRGGAAHALGGIGSLRAVPGLREAMVGTGDYIGGAASGALTSTLWKVIDHSFEKVEAAEGGDDFDEGVVQSLAKELGVFEFEWFAKQVDQRIKPSTDDRYRRFVMRVRAVLANS